MCIRDRFFSLLVLAAAAPARAQETGAVTVAGGVRYEFLERWDVARLNEVLTKDIPAFAGIGVTYTPAKNAVKLYRVTYPSVIPERGNRPTVATGLIAIPDVEGRSFPLVSYQHGTVDLPVKRDVALGMYTMVRFRKRTEAEMASAHESVALVG